MAASTSRHGGRAHGTLTRGQFVLLSTKGDVWRFDEEETDNWHRIPEGRQPLLLVKPFSKIELACITIKT